MLVLKKVTKSTFGVAASGLLMAIAMCIWPQFAWSQDDAQSYTRAFSLYWENDSFTGTDQDYSNGLKMTWSQAYEPSAEKKSPIKGWMFKYLPLMNKPDTRRATSFSIGQNIFTPEDTQRTDLIENDRPYAGYSYMGFGFSSIEGTRQDVWEFEIGIVGPSSKAEATQDWVHDIIEADRAGGWDNQLENELGLNLTFVSYWRLRWLGSGSGFSIDVIPHLGARLGNVAIYADTGAEIRFGWSVPEDFGTCPIRPGCPAVGSIDTSVGFSEFRRQKFGIYIFFAGEGRAVIRDIFLDGNTFQKSHSVDKETLVADLMGGVAMHYGRFRMTYAMVLRTKEFEERDDNHSFGAISLSYLY
jgi:lipid A 3-O-deacylase